MSVARKQYIEVNGCYMTGNQQTEKSKGLISRNRKGKCMGEEHPHWNDGSSFEPYGVDFNNVLRERIRKRDGYVCQCCGIAQEELGYSLSVHHIDYDKKNNELSNLISLCNVCHGKTNHNRDMWKIHFENVIGGIENYTGTQIIKEESLH